jgi:hypothetical protein
LENLKERDHSDDLGINVKILEWNLGETGSEGVDWIHLAQDSGQRQALVNMVMKLQVP